MVGYIETMTLFTLTNEVAYVAVRYLYGELGDNCATACERLGDYECHFDHFFYELTMEERKVLMFNASKKIAGPMNWDRNFATDGSKEVRSFVLPGFVVATKMIIGYKNTQDKVNTTLCCNAKLYETTQRRFCACRKKVTDRSFFVGLPGAKCWDTCKCHGMLCQNSFLEYPPDYNVNETERKQVLYATAKLYQEYKKLPFSIMFSFDTSPNLGSYAPYFSKNTTIFGWQNVFAGGNCLTVANVAHQGFCECYHPLTPMVTGKSLVIDWPDCDVMGGGGAVRACFIGTLAMLLVHRLLH